MANITITNTDEGFMTLWEGLTPSDMESEFFCAHLVERMRWAVEDAHRARPPVQLQRPQRASAGAPQLKAVLPA